MKEWSCKKHGRKSFKLRDKGKYKTHQCLICREEQKRESRRTSKFKLIYMFGGKCCVCGYQKSIRSLEFHHLIPAEKKFEISTGSIVSFNRLVEEAKRCVLVCSNCHGEIEDGITLVTPTMISKTKLAIDTELNLILGDKHVINN